MNQLTVPIILIGLVSPKSFKINKESIKLPKFLIAGLIELKEPFKI